MTKVAEIVTFRLADGVTDVGFLEISKSTESFVRDAPGFLYRQLSCAEDGVWTDYVVWSDMVAAKAAAAAFPNQDFAPAVMAAIVPDSVQMRHQSVLWDIAA